VAQPQSIINQNRFQQIVALTGLSSLFGPGTVRRALQDVGATLEEATVEDYQKVLPRLKLRIAVYLGEEKANENILNIETFLKQM
jgi:hypothetical protein